MITTIKDFNSKLVENGATYSIEISVGEPLEADDLLKIQQLMGEFKEIVAKYTAISKAKSAALKG